MYGVVKDSITGAEMYTRMKMSTVFIEKNYDEREKSVEGKKYHSCHHYNDDANRLYSYPNEATSFRRLSQIFVHRYV